MGTGVQAKLAGQRTTGGYRASPVSGESRWDRRRRAGQGLDRGRALGAC